MARTIQELKDDASIIKNETDAGDNTASRVGTMFLDIIEYLGNLNTSSGSEDEGGSGGGGGGGVSLNEPLSSINNLARTPGSGNKVLVCQNGVWDYGDYGGGSTPTSGVTWNALAGSTDEQINLTHLTTALNSCSFWGRNPVNGVVSGDMIDVGSITMNGKITMYNATNDKVEIYVDQSGNLRFNGNIYATGGVSALGNSSSGGGGGGGSTVIWNQRVTSGTWIATVTIDGTSTDVYAPTSGGAGGATTLGGLNDVTLSSLDDGHYLRYNSGNNEWRNAAFSPVIKVLNAIPEGSYTGRYILSATNGNWSLTEAPSSGISQISYSDTGNAVTAASISGTTLTLTRGKTFLTSLPVASVNTLGGIKVGSNLTINSNGVLSVNGTNLSVASASTAASATEAGKLSDNTARKAWGQTYWQGGQPKEINGIMTGVSTIKMNYGSGPNYIEMPNNSSLKIAPAAGTEIWNNRTHVEAILLNQGNQLSFGYGARIYNFQTDIQGGSSITFATSAVNGAGDSRRDVGGFTKAGQFYVEQGTQGIRIGNGIIKWDSTHDALYVVKDGGGVANFYASGGVSALGFSNGSNGSVTVADLDVENLAVDRITPNNGDEVYFGDEDSNTYINVNGDIEVQNALSTDIRSGFTWVPMLRLGIKASTYTPSNNVCSLYVKKVNRVNKLYFCNGSSEIQIA